MIEGDGDRATPASPKGTGDFTHDRGGCHKTEMTHSEQITDTSSLNMFYNDELFSSMVLGTNFFRVAGLESKFAAPPLCRHDPTEPQATQTDGWTPKAATANAMIQSAVATTTLAATPSAETAPSYSMPQANGAVPSSSSWMVAVVAVAGATGLFGLIRFVGRKKRASKLAAEEGIPYRLQRGDAPLLANENN